MKALIIPAYIEGGIRDIVGGEELEERYIICADAGYDRAAEEGIRPSLIIGDLDSVTGGLPEGVELIRSPSHKDDTDLGLALREAEKRGADDIIIAGGFGGRADHTIGNIQNIVRARRDGVQVKMEDSSNMMIPAENETVRIPASDWRYLSVLAHTDSASVTIKGAEYPLSRHKLQNDFPLGVSNEITGEGAVITVHEGTVLIILAK